MHNKYLRGGLQKNCHRRSSHGCAEKQRVTNSLELHGLIFISEASSRDPFVFSTLRQPRCMEWMALVDLMVTL